jgi:hypothetical protein
MQLTSFEKEISNVILQRGKDYFSEGTVIDLQIMDNGQYFAIAEGKLNLLQKSPRINSLLRYGDYLVNDYAQDMIRLYHKAIEEEAKRSSNRNDYKTIASYISKMAKITNGKDPARLLTESLIDTYPKRPAMIDEPGKILHKKVFK